METTTNGNVELRKVDVSFKVKLGKDDEAREVKFTCMINPVSDFNLLVEEAMKSQVIKWQAQIRNNWDKFVKPDYVIPESLNFGDALFGAKSRTTRPPTKEELKTLLKKLSQDELLHFMETGEVPDHIFE